MKRFKKNHPKLIKDTNTFNKHRSIRNLFWYFWLFPVLVHADFLDNLNNVLSYATGKLGVVVATGAVLVLAFLVCIAGVVDKKYLISVIVGSAMIFGAHTIVNGIEYGF